MKKNTDDYIKEALGNIRHDRAVTKGLLTDLLICLNKNKSQDSHRDMGAIAAKYVETLQRSNEQLVKLTGMLSKKDKAPESLTDEDKDELFDLIKESG